MYVPPTELLITFGKKIQVRNQPVSHCRMEWHHLFFKKYYIRKTNSLVFGQRLMAILALILVDRHKCLRLNFSHWVDVQDSLPNMRSIRNILEWFGTLKSELLIDTFQRSNAHLFPVFLASIFKVMQFDFIMLLR